MAVVSAGAIITAILGAISYTQAIVGEGWTRYFILVAGMSVNQAIGSFTGFYALEGLLSAVVINVFGIQGFIFPVYGGVSSLLVLIVFFPVILLILKDLLIGQ